MLLDMHIAKVEFCNNFCSIYWTSPKFGHKIHMSNCNIWMWHLLGNHVTWPRWPPFSKNIFKPPGEAENNIIEFWKCMIQFKLTLSIWIRLWIWCYNDISKIYQRMEVSFKVCNAWNGHFQAWNSVNGNAITSCT